LAEPAAASSYGCDDVRLVFVGRDVAPACGEVAGVQILDYVIRIEAISGTAHAGSVTPASEQAASSAISSL
jgi:hypothetical protein